MFKQLTDDFEDRVREVDLFFRVLELQDKDRVVAVSDSEQTGDPFSSLPDDWGEMLKGASYLIIYNLVEAFVRRGFQKVFETIENDGLCGGQLAESLRSQWIMQKNKRISTFDGSPKVYMEISNEIVNEIIEHRVARLSHRRLPFSGNLDADVIREVCACHGVGQETPPIAKGGSALNLVKKKRNSLSHGDESFVECGRQTTAADLVSAKDEIIHFMRGILSNLEQFVSEKRYKA
ncbi:MAG: MAE_28990/MAE_18760 family HEPN-like nuclease [Planctomycetia bacterium]